MFKVYLALRCVTFACICVVACFTGAGSAFADAPAADAPAVAVPAAATAPKPRADGLYRGRDYVLQKNHNGLGLSVGVGGMNGFAYRHYWDNTSIQFDLLPLYADKGNYVAIHLGAQIIQYMLAWNSARELGGTSSALRLVGAYSIRIARDDSVATVEIPTPNCLTAACQANLTGNKSKMDYFNSAALGFGVEFGGIGRSGFSVSVDMMMTVMWDREGFFGAYPLPYGALMYNF